MAGVKERKPFENEWHYSGNGATEMNNANEKIHTQTSIKN